MEKIDRKATRECEWLYKVTDKLDEIVEWINEQEKDEAEALKEAVKSAILALKDNDTPTAIEILKLWAKQRRPY